MRFAKLALCLAALCAAICFWKITNPNLYWQIRAGSDIIHNREIAAFDSWTNTSLHNPWINYAWFTSVLFYYISDLISNEAIFSLLRTLGVFGLFLGVQNLILKSSKNEENATRVSLFLIPLFFFMGFRQFEMGPEFIAYLLFTALLSNWLSSYPERIKTGIGFLILIAWTNFHAGIVWIGLLAQGVFILESKEPPKIRAGAIAATVLTVFLSPLKFSVLHAFGRGIDPSQNPILVFVAWIIVSSAVACLLFQQKRFSLRIVLLALLTACAIWKSGLIPFQMIVLMTVLAPELELAKEAKPLSIAAGVAWLSVVLLVFLASPRFGVGTDERLFPVKGTQFLIDASPKRSLLNTTEFGGYLIDKAPRFPVSSDTRELVTEGFQHQYWVQSGDPISFTAFLGNYDFNIAMLRPSARNRIQFPLATWALIFTDGLSEIYVRRLPENQPIITQYEIK